MDAKELIERIEGYQGDVPTPRFVTSQYAEVIAKLADRVTPDEMDQLIALGALVKKRSSQRVPVYNLDTIPDEILNRRSAFSAPAGSD